MIWRMTDGWGRQVDHAAAHNAEMTMEKNAVWESEKMRQRVNLGKTTRWEEKGKYIVESPKDPNKLQILHFSLPCSAITLLHSARHSLSRSRWRLGPHHSPLPPSSETLGQMSTHPVCRAVSPVMFRGQTLQTRQRSSRLFLRFHLAPVRVSACCGRHLSPWKMETLRAVVVAGASDRRDPARAPRLAILLWRPGAIDALHHAYSSLPEQEIGEWNWKGH